MSRRLINIEYIIEADYLKKIYQNQNLFIQTRLKNQCVCVGQGEKFTLNRSADHS